MKPKFTLADRAISRSNAVKHLLPSTFATGFADGVAASALGFTANLHSLGAADGADAAISALLSFFFVFVLGGLLLHRLPFLGGDRSSDSSIVSRKICDAIVDFLDDYSLNLHDVGELETRILVDSNARRECKAFHSVISSNARRGQLGGEIRWRRRFQRQVLGNDSGGGRSLCYQRQGS